MIGKVAHHNLSDAAGGASSLRGMIIPQPTFISPNAVIKNEQ